MKEERNYILQMIKKIRASGANVLLIQKSILRDAVTDLSLHYLVSPHTEHVRSAKAQQCKHLCTFCSPASLKSSEDTEDLQNHPPINLKHQLQSDIY